MNQITIKYHNFKMLMTLDLNTLVSVIIDNYGENISVAFQAMNEDEQTESIETVDGIEIVRERFWIIECIEIKNGKRRKDLEKKVIKEGIK